MDRCMNRLTEWWIDEEMDEWMDGLHWWLEIHWEVQSINDWVKQSTQWTVEQRMDNRPLKMQKNDWTNEMDKRMNALIKHSTDQLLELINYSTNWMESIESIK